MSTLIERLEALREASGVGRLRHVAGIIKHYVASEPCDEWGNSPDDAAFAGFSLQEMSPRNGQDVPAAAQAEFIVTALNTLPDLLKVARLLWEDGCEDSGTKTENCWDHEADDWPRGKWCQRCAALEPLFRDQVQSG
jgi:hypothetical protein